MLEALPIDALRAPFEEALTRGPVVITSPTGSGKSTQVPRWCADRGPVLVVEPRRVACRALAARVAELEGAPLGGRVGYAVRDERRSDRDTAILFVTTGVALRLVQSGEVDRFATVVLDELHERTLDLDLLLALLHGRRLVAMSATLDGPRVAEHLGGTHLHAGGRQHPVRVVHPADAPPVPEARGLEDRVARALASCPPEGDVLVFLPGKGEIGRVVDRLSGRPDLDVLPLHGGLTLDQQARVFARGRRRRVICATNVAETSLTLPGIRVVIDTGLVRRTRYHRGRATLTLLPIARDAADQRAGRAGRTAPGTAVRLWQERAPLDASTPPELHRESLVPLLLAAAACGSPVLDLPFLDPPRPHALDDAREALRGLGALDADGRITSTGLALFGLPLDPSLGRLLVEARAAGTDALHDAIDLVAALSVPRPLFRGPRPADPADDLREPGCDAVAAVRAVREGVPRQHHLDAHALAEARAGAARLRRAFGLEAGGGPFGRPERERMARLALGAWPDCAHVARRRKRRVGWSNGGTELVLARESAVDAEKAEAVLVLDVRAFGRSRLEQELLCTSAMPVSLGLLRELDLGRDRLAGAVLVGGEAHARIERVYAGRVLQERTEVPEGALAREAVAELFLAGRIFDVHAARDRLEALALQARLHDEAPPPELEDWVTARLEALGLESGAELPLLSTDDLLPDDLDPLDRERLDREFPRELRLPDATYRLRYEVKRRTLVLDKVGGPRKELPPLRFVPSVPGWRIEVRDKHVTRVLRR